MQILNQQQEALLKRERQLLSDLRVSLVEFGATPEDQDTLAESLRQLDELFLLVIVGEFNAGKSAFINALLGQRLLKEGVTPTTTQINILKFGPEQERSVTNENTRVIYLPVEWLSEISIVDTPGTNAIIRAHEEITSQFVPRSDLVIFITSADRPFTESERAFMERIRDWGKKVVIVINKVDIFENIEELDQVKGFVAENARQLLGVTPEIFPVSARMALRAKNGETDLWEKSNFQALEDFIYQTLDETSRVRLKLLNPLGVALHLVERYSGVTETRLDLLKSDFEMLSDVESQLALYSEDMHRDFKFRMADIENILFEMEQRGEEFFDDTFRLARVFDLLSKERIQQQFEHKVVGDTPQRIEQRVGELIDWLVDADLRQWQAVNEHLAERRRAYEDRIVGETGIGSFKYDRERLMDSVGRQAQRVIETYDKTDEARAIAEGAQQAVAASAALEAGAIGLGTLVTLLATTMAADVTGVLLASAIAAIGLFVIPARRVRAKEEMRLKVADLRQGLVGSLTSQFEKEIERSMHGINDAIAPYTRFVRSERTKLTESAAALRRIHTEMEQIKGQIEDI